LKNLFSNIPESINEELFEILVENQHLMLERIVSDGQATPPNEWYDQDINEWVILLRGSAGILFEGDEKAIALQPGDYILIPAHRRHRVEWTDQKEKTIWLALKYRG
jgi:cupin 2 domain-containing protein